MKTTITRIWHGRTRIEDADVYLEYIRQTGVRDYRSTPGYISSQILRRKEGQVCHFWTVSRWDSIESIRKFAGEEYEKARYYPEDKEYLLDFEDDVLHCETFDL